MDYLMRLKELSDISGCLLAVVIDNDGKCLAFQGKERLKGESIEQMTQAMAAVTSALDKLSVELEVLTGRSCLPQEGWVYLGPGVAAIMGNGGYRGIVMDNLDSKQMDALKSCFGMIEEGKLKIGEL